MKKYLIGCLLILLIVPLVNAQAGTKKVMPLSGRYSFEVPENWIATTNPVDSTQGLFPAEALSIAPPQTESISGFETLDSSDFAGEGIVAVVWPAGFLAALELTVTGFGAQIATANAQQLEKSVLDVGEVRGDKYEVVQANGVHLRVLAGADAEGNLLLILGFAPEDTISEIDAILDTLAYTDLSDQTDPTLTVEILEGAASVKIPPSWWLADADGLPIIASDFSAATFRAEFDALEGVFMTAFEREKSLFPEEAYNADGTLNAEIVVEEFDLAGILGSNPDFDGEIAVETWTNDDGLTGILLDIQNERRVQIVIADGETRLVALMALAPADVWDDYAETVAAIFETLRLEK